MRVGSIWCLSREVNAVNERAVVKHGGDASLFQPASNGMMCSTENDWVANWAWLRQKGDALGIPFLNFNHEVN